MSYATHDDIENLIPGRKYNFTAITLPSTAQVDAYCEQITEELDGYLARAGYLTPVTDDQALKLLKLWTCYGVVPLVEIASRPDEISPEEKDIGGFYRKLYEQVLASIVNRVIDAPMSTSFGGMSSYWSAHPDDTDARDAMFKREDRY